MSRSFSPSRIHGSARLQFGGGVSQRLRSSSFKKPPEPLRRAVADCLSSSSSSHHGNPTIVASEAARTLRDYLAASTTTDLAYCVVIEHTLAERERRYVPSEQTLLQIDLFCVNSIFECDSNTNRGASPWSKSLSQQSISSIGFVNTILSSSLTPSFVSGPLVKSLNYVRSLVARHIPKRSFQPAVFAGTSVASKNSLPTLSSLLSRSFNSQLSPGAVIGRESPERKETTCLSVSDSSNVERVEDKEETDYIPIDVFNWRWLQQQQSPVNTTESDGVMRPQEVSSPSFLEVGAAALLIGDADAKVKGQLWERSDTNVPADLDQLLQPSAVTASNFASAHSHLRVITASKRTKAGPHQIWEDSPVSTYRPRSRPLFQYRPYSEQQPLRLNPAEVHEVIAAVCSETSLPKSNLMTVSSKLSNNSGKPSIDVAVSVLIKLVIDMYVLDSQTAAPLTLSMLEEMLSSTRSASRVRVFDLILNLGVHAHLLESMLPDEPSTIEEECSEELYLNNERQLNAPQIQKSTSSRKQNGHSSSIDNFESWLLSILKEILLLLVQIEEKEESIWASALSCLLYFVCDMGEICRNRLEGLDIRVIKALLEIDRDNSWAELVHCKLICMLTNMFYQVPNDPGETLLVPIFLAEQVDHLGGIDFICLEYSRANSREEKRNLFAVLFDYVLHRINEARLATGDSEYSFDEVEPLAVVLALADAPEAYYISVKHGVEGIGEIMSKSISATLSRYPNSERLNMLWEKIARNLEIIISSFSHLDEEFSRMICTTKLHKSLENVEDGVLENGAGMGVKLSWTTLHTLLHSERSSCRQNGYIWLVELLLAEIRLEKGKSISIGIGNLQQKIGLAGSQDYTIGSEVPVSIWILCGLLKSKHNYIRWGFLFVLEKLLMRCKMLLDENELQRSNSGELSGWNPGDIRLEKANAVIDIMSSALSSVAQINETDRINILKMCHMLFAQLCLRRLSATPMPLGDLTSLDKVFGTTEESERADGDPKNHRMAAYSKETIIDHSSPFICKTASLAALLLRGQAIVPMQLVARVPTALLYWPLIQLAGAAADDIALGVAVGSKGRGNLPGATSDIRAALLLLLIGKCSDDPAAFQEVGGEEFFRELLDDTDSRVAFYSSAFLLKRMMTEEPEKYQRMLQNLIFRAQQCNNEKLLENPYLQIRGILQLSNDLGAGL
ncbi:hypothetical protein GIB67_021430 [Kingdonia uniflora]|uniref:Uncharacterized protein n=1 Tax=Kingdonia uniflora TaxID=39325 RepID=A0A7J7NQD7_9MAGN|nr:hypothetical protein GIB67_021430 [Kingdonia uniflora]